MRNCRIGRFLVFIKYEYLNIDKIIKGCKKGDIKSKEALVELYAPMLMSVCERYCKDKTIAKDALQETFINIFKYIGTYSSKGSFEGWIRRIAVNCSYAFINKIHTVYFIEEENVTFSQLEQIPDVYSDLAEQDLLKLINKLPLNQYLVFNMYVIEGFKHEEIAEILNIGTTTSRSNLSRARSNLIRILQESTIVENKKFLNR